MPNKPDPEINKVLNQFAKTDGPIYNGPFDSREIDIQMSIPHPRGRVIEMMAKAISAANHSPEYWHTLDDSDKEQLRITARAAISVVEPAVNWGHFIDTENYSDEVIY